MSTPPTPPAPFRLRQLLALFTFTRGYKGHYIAYVFFLIFQVATYQLLAYSLKYLINNLFPLKQVPPLLWFATVWAGIFGVHMLITFTAARLRIIMSRNLVANIRAELIRKMQVLSIGYFDVRGTGATSAKLLMDVDRLQGFFDWFLASFLTAIIMCICAVPYLASINPLLTGITLLYLPMVPLLQRIFQKKMMARSHQLRNSVARLSEKLIDYISGIRQIRIFANEDDFSHDIMDEIHGVREIDIRYQLTALRLQMLIQFFRQSVPILLWVTAGILMVRDTTLTVGSVVAYIALVDGLMNAITILYSSFDQVVITTPSLAAVMEILESDAIENPNPRVKDFTLDGGIEFNNVSFSYKTREEQRQLTDVTLRIAPGEKVALVGESGSGKSTWVNVLLGLYPLTTGSIHFGPHEIRDMDLKRLRSQIAIMTQDTFLFNTTLLENVRFGNLAASQEAIENACKKAQIYDFIASLPEGLNTFCGERGVQLSGGQRQRIGLARLFLRSPKIIVLDEPSSALDVVTEQKLFETLFANLAGVTLIVIAHRLSVIKNVDRIFVFREGRLEEEGTFETLSHRPGVFASMLAANAAPA